MENNKKIEKILIFQCGYCKNNLKRVFQDAANSEAAFPANVFCIVHREKGILLFDTGYSNLVYENGLISKLYNRFNPTVVKEEDYLPQKLALHQIQCTDVTYIILSHAHPDHMGGLCFFPNAEIILSPEVYATIMGHSWKDLVFKNMKKSFTHKYQLLYRGAASPLLSPYFPENYDVFGDGSIYGVKLNGHANGQMGLYVPAYHLLLAADSAWRVDFMEQTEKMRFLPRQIQHSYHDYLQTVKSLRRFMKEHPEITVIFSHSSMKEGVYEK